MDIRYSMNPDQIKRCTTQELRDEFLIRDLYRPDEVVAVYSHVDRMVTMGVMPISGPIAVDKGMDVWKTFGVNYLFERREAGFFNLGGAGVCTVDGKEYAMDYKDCLYITCGSKDVTFTSIDGKNPARFYGVSAPAHCSYQTQLLTIADAAKKPVGADETSNKRVINQFIHPDVLKTCQLSMGLTELAPGSMWNTMPSHTHERRMEVYTYFEIPEGNVVFHLMGQPQETRHIVVQNYEAIISPSYSIHSGCGTGSYTFIWAMAGENLAFDDMNVIDTTALR